MNKLGCSATYAFLLSSVIVTLSLNAQADQRAIAQQLLRTDQAERASAVRSAGDIDPAAIGPELRAALIATLDREATTHLQRDAAHRRGEPLPHLEDPEFIFAVARLVADLKDPQAIPAFAAALGTGILVPRTLAGFGELAASAVVAVVRSSQSSDAAVTDGLITLRFMVEQADVRPLTAATREAIRTVAEQRLTEKPRHIGTTWWAIDLAVALGDPGLRRIVQALASDPAQLIARGVTDSSLVAQTQKRAADRLAGIPALPRPGL